MKSKEIMAIDSFLFQNKSQGREHSNWLVCVWCVCVCVCDVCVCVCDVCVCFGVGVRAFQ